MNSVILLCKIFITPLLALDFLLGNFLPLVVALLMNLISLSILDCCRSDNIAPICDSNDQNLQSLALPDIPPKPSTRQHHSSTTTHLSHLRIYDAT